MNIGGVAREFEHILKRLHSEEEKYEGTFNPLQAKYSVIPVLLQGLLEQSTPRAMTQRLYADLSLVSVSENGSGPQTAKEKSEFQKICNSIAATVSQNAYSASDKFDVSHGSWKKKLLFDTKFDIDDYNRDQSFYADRIFMRTTAIRLTINSPANLVVGRKGSGKTTLTALLGDIRSIPVSMKGHIHIDMGAIPVKEVYDQFVTISSQSSDISYLFTRSKYLAFFWEGVIFHVTVDLLCRLSQHFELNQAQVESLARLRSSYSDKFHWTEYHSINEKYSTFVSNVTDGLQRFKEYAIESARNEESTWRSDIASILSRENWLRFLLGDEDLASLRSILASCRRQILITFDGIDTETDLFRRGESEPLSSSEIAKRSRFEAYLYLQLLEILSEKGREASGRDAALYRLIRYAIAIPQDRYEEIMLLNRDAIKHIGAVRRLTWSGIELAIMLAKRLEVIADIPKNKRPDPTSTTHQSLLRLRAALEKSTPKLPVTVETVRGEQIQLFHYVLRHTMWRPRDVLFHFSHLFSVYESANFLRKDDVQQFIRSAISSSTEKLIKTEYIGEFASVIQNIEQILYAFRGAKPILSIDQIAEVLKPVDIRYVASEDTVENLEDKLRFLYESGFLGYRSIRQKGKRGTGATETYVFTHGFAKFEQEVRGRSEKWEYIIHPMFSEYLSIDTRGSEFVFRLSDKFLSENDIAVTTNRF